MAYLGFAFVVLLAMVHNGSALRCWACSSDLDPSCLDHFNSTKLLQQRQYYQQANNQYNNNNNNQNNQQFNRNGIPTLLECSNNLGQIYGQKQVCVKRVLNVPYGRKIISRECKSISMNQAIGTCPDKNNNVEFCEYCEYDGCNAATGLRTNILLAAALPAMVLLFLRR